MASSRKTSSFSATEHAQPDPFAVPVSVQGNSCDMRNGDDQKGDAKKLMHLADVFDLAKDR